MKGYDYSQQGMYFVTVRTQDVGRVFGQVKEGQVKLSAIGEIAKRCWERIPEHFEGVELDEYVVMPNHVHGVIIITQSLVRTRPPKKRAGKHAVSIRGEHTEKSRKASGFGNPVSGSLSTIVGSFKSAASKQIRVLGH